MRKFCALDFSKLLFPPAVSAGLDRLCCKISQFFLERQNQKPMVDRS